MLEFIFTMAPAISLFCVIVFFSSTFVKFIRKQTIPAFNFMALTAAIVIFLLSKGWL